jgi:putative CocE/NonD family hydrolase
LFVTSTAVDTDFFAKLCLVDGQDVSHNVVDGLVRTRWRHGGDEPMPLVPGDVVECTIDLGPIALHVRPGQRIRLQVASSCFPAFDRNMNTGNATGVDAEGVVARQTVFHTPELPSHLSLFIDPRD